MFSADDVYDSEDAKQRAAGYLQNRSMECQTGSVKREGNWRLVPGTRVTVKYVGESFSGEYIAERVVHELSVSRGFTTEVYVKRNMSGRQQRSVSVLDSERFQAREGAVSGDASEVDIKTLKQGQYFILMER